MLGKCMTPRIARITNTTGISMDLDRTKCLGTLIGIKRRSKDSQGRCVRLTLPKRKMKP